MPVRSGDLAGTLAPMARSTLARSPGGALTLVGVAIGAISRVERHVGAVVTAVDDASIYNKMRSVKRQFCTNRVQDGENEPEMWV